MHLIQVGIHSERYPTSRCYPFNIPALRATPELRIQEAGRLFRGRERVGQVHPAGGHHPEVRHPVWDKPRRHAAHNNPYETRLSDYIEVTWADGACPAHCSGPRRSTTWPICSTMWPCAIRAGYSTTAAASSTRCRTARGC